jgi:hypothetical protein
MSNGYIIEIFEWVFIPRDFIGFSFRIFKVISQYQLTTFFNMSFDLVLRGFASE